VTSSSNSSRSFSGIKFAAVLAMRQPRRLATLVRALGASLLDEQFDAQSKIAAIPDRVDRSLAGQIVTLPPRLMFGPGTQDFSGLSALVELARAIEARSIFEIGTFHGTTALALAMNIPEAEIHTLDLPSGVERGVLPVFMTDSANIAARTTRVFEGRHEAARIAEHFDDSARFDFEPFRARMDVVYVDGAHSFEYLANDTAAAELMVSPRGVIVWDDYWRRTPDVASYLHQRSDKTLLRIPGTRLVVWLSEDAETQLERGVVSNAHPTTGLAPVVPRGPMRSP
jgi:predicted O-methyltransferase YrrM